MINIIINTIIGATLLSFLSYILVRIGEQRRRTASESQIKKFMFFEKYYTEMETEAERRMEKRRMERMDIFKQDNGKKAEGSENINISRLTRKTAV